MLTMFWGKTVSCFARTDVSASCIAWPRPTPLVAVQRPDTTRRWYVCVLGLRLYLIVFFDASLVQTNVLHAPYFF